MICHVPDTVVALWYKAGSGAVLCMSGSFRSSISSLIFDFASVDLEQIVYVKIVLKNSLTHIQCKGQSIFIIDQGWGQDNLAILVYKNAKRKWGK